jgi:hypothetical protein
MLRYAYLSNGRRNRHSCGFFYQVLNGADIFFSGKFSYIAGNRTEKRKDDRAGKPYIKEQMRQKPRSLFLVLVIAFFAIVISPRFLLGESSPGTESKPITIEEITSKDGHLYTIFRKNNSKISFEITRPDKDDKNIYLCIPAAFTDLQTYGVDGACLSKGKLNNSKINNTIGGALKIVNGQCSIIDTQKGKLLTDSMLSAIAAKGGSLFQQIKIISNGKPATFKDTQLFQRRAIVQMKDKSWSVIESLQAITLADFSADLAEMGVSDALYTDMGSWDEGWYRNPSSGKTTTIGQIRSETSKQTNWIIFTAK